MIRHRPHCRDHELEEDISDGYVFAGRDIAGHLRVTRDEEHDQTRARHRNGCGQSTSADRIISFIFFNPMSQSTIAKGSALSQFLLGT